MRKSISFFVLVVFFLACNSVEQHRQAIETLASGWETTSNNVKGFAAQLDAAYSRLEQRKKNMQPDEQAMAKLDDAAKTKMIELQNQINGYGQTLADMQREIKAFMGPWEENSEKLDMLKDGLASGQLPKDVATTIQNLNEVLNNGKTTFGNWQEKFRATQPALDTAIRELNSLSLSIQQ